VIRARVRVDTILWRANSCFAHDSSGFPVLPQFFGARTRVVAAGQGWRRFSQPLVQGPMGTGIDFAGLAPPKFSRSTRFHSYSAPKAHPANLKTVLSY
jgi:hypothetical protein